MKELSREYEPVPFDHKTHAAMAEMWDGCTTCHHRNPAPATAPAIAVDRHDRSQQRASQTPACKSCHVISTDDIESVDIRMPTLKGAYHRQCLNCHREWAQSNECAICHQHRTAAHATSSAATRRSPTPDDIVGRMHPPIPEPVVKTYRTRFLPAVGGNAIFRHKEHVEKFDLKCVSCHRRDTCADCHDASARTLVAENRPLRPGRTWRDSHGACVSCHETDRCRHCHYPDGQTPPPPFDHALTRQPLDKTHGGLKCAQCHDGHLKLHRVTTCGGAECHEGNRIFTYPADKPGPVVAVHATPTTRSAATAPATTQSATKPVIRRIRLQEAGEDEKSPTREMAVPP